jgi:hypothetical protein
MPAKRDISQEILEYLRKHPDASDTLEGITEWWLLSQRINYEMKKVKNVIFELVKDGRLIETHGKDFSIRYRFNPVNPEKFGNLK